jgi:hypothetical protein
MRTTQNAVWLQKAMRRYKTANVIGEGPIALVLPCRDMKVILGETVDEAERLRQSIGNQCGGACWGIHMHRIEDLRLRRPRRPRW